MAYPSVVDSASSKTNSAISLSLTMPASIVAGNLLLAIVGAKGVPSLSGWTSVGTATNGANNFAVFALTAVGGDTGTVSIASPNAIDVMVYQVSGWSGSIAGIGYASASGTISAPNPPNLTMAAGSNTYLWFAATIGSATVSAGPSGFSGFTTVVESSFVLGTAWLQATAASEDPGTFTGTSTNWVAATVGIPPSGGGNPPPLVTITNQSVMRASFY